MPTEIYLTGYVKVDPNTGQESLVTLPGNGERIPPDTLRTYKNAAKLHIRETPGSPIRDYNVLVERDYEGCPPVACQCQVNTGPATLHLTIGWAMLAGDLPIAETELVTTSPQGTLMAVRVQQAAQGAPRQDYVYNLEPEGSGKTIRAQSADRTRDLPPRTYVTVTEEPASLSLPAPIEEHDPFVDHMENRAAFTNFPMV